MHTFTFEADIRHRRPRTNVHKVKQSHMNVYRSKRDEIRGLLRSRRIRTRESESQRIPETVFDLMLDDENDRRDWVHMALVVRASFTDEPYCTYTIRRKYGWVQGHLVSLLDTENAIMKELERVRADPLYEDEMDNIGQPSAPATAMDAYLNNKKLVSAFLDDQGIRYVETVKNYPDDQTVYKLYFDDDNADRCHMVIALAPVKAGSPFCAYTARRDEWASMSASTFDAFAEVVVHESKFFDWINPVVADPDNIAPPKIPQLIGRIGRTTTLPHILSNRNDIDMDVPARSLSVGGNGKGHLAAGVVALAFACVATSLVMS